MMFKIKATAAAATLVLAGSAFADIDNFASGNGELFFNVYDPVAKVSFVLDLTPAPGFGTFNVADFLPNSYTRDLNGAAAGTGNPLASNLTSAAIAGAPVGTPSAAETQGLKLTWMLDNSTNDFQTFVANSDPANWSWSVIGGDNTGSQNVNHARRYLLTSKAEIGTVDNLSISNMNGFSNNDSLYINALNNKDGNDADDWSDYNTNADNPGTYYGNRFGENWNNLTPYSHNAKLGESQNFYYITGRGASNVAVAQFGNDVGAAKWMFGSKAGGGYELTYMAPIPEPGTYALMALGLVGLGLMARRRK